MALLAIASFSFSTLMAPAARAYNYNTHSRIAELAVRAMRTAPAADAPLFFPPAGEEALYQEYMNTARSSAASLAQLKTGLLPKIQDSSLNIVPDQGDTTLFPFWTESGTNCEPDEARELNNLDKFRIADLDYYPARTGPCGIETPALKGKGDGANPNLPGQVQARVTELVLGWHAGGVDLRGSLRLQSNRSNYAGAVRRALLGRLARLSVEGGYPVVVRLRSAG